MEMLRGETLERARKGLALGTQLGRHRARGLKSRERATNHPLSPNPPSVLTEDRLSGLAWESPQRLYYVQDAVSSIYTRARDVRSIDPSYAKVGIVRGVRVQGFAAVLAEGGLLLVSFTFFRLLAHFAPPPLMVLTKAVMLTEVSAS